MKGALLIALLLAVPALAQASRDAGYRDCSPKKLAACQDTNQLFFGPFRGGRGSEPKREFSGALSKFLAGAPKLYAGKVSFRVKAVATESLTGPGDHHDRLPDGVWFFDGFTPHYGVDRGAVLFTPDGAILAVALVNTSADTPGAFDQASVRLRVYAHDREPSPDQVKLLRSWAGGDLIGKSLYPGALPVRHLVEARLIRRNGNIWSSHTLP